MRYSRFNIVAAACTCLVLFCAAGVQASTITVNPTGQFPADQNAIQNALNSAQPGDVIVLGAGVFNLTGSSNAALSVSTPDVTLLGAPAQASVLDGPGLSVGDGCFVLNGDASGFTIQGVHIRNFPFGVLALPDLNNVAVIDCHFDGIGTAVQALGHGAHVGWRLVGNQVVLPPFAEAQYAASLQLAGFWLPCEQDAVVTDNTLNGPGPDQALAGTILIVSIGVFTRPVGATACSVAPAGGLIARNSVSGFDAGIAAISSAVVVDGNDVTGCRFGLGVGANGPAANNLPTVDTEVIDNVSSGNSEFGLVLIGAQHTLVLENDLRHNGSGASGTLDRFTSNPPVLSLDNAFRDNTDNSVVPLTLDPSTLQYSRAHGTH